MTEEKWGFFVDAKRLIGFIVALVLLASAFGVGYIVGEGNGRASVHCPSDGDGGMRRDKR